VTSSWKLLLVRIRIVPPAIFAALYGHWPLVTPITRGGLEIFKSQDKFSGENSQLALLTVGVTIPGALTVGINKGFKSSLLSTPSRAHTLARVGGTSECMIFSFPSSHNAHFVVRIIFLLQHPQRCGCTVNFAI
jgi:hypothetical protein